jgi:hypothetical protein
VVSGNSLRAITAWVDEGRRTDQALL